MRKTNHWKGLVLGVVGSAVGLVAMQAYWNYVAPIISRGDEKVEQGNGQNQSDALDDISVVGQQHEPQESSTAAVGRILYEHETGQDPNSQTKTTLSYLVHWLYGLTMGALYGVLRLSTQGIDLLGGAVFATGLWLLG